MRQFLCTLSFPLLLLGAVSCGDDDDDTSATVETPNQELGDAEDSPDSPTVPNVTWHSWEDAADVLEEADLSPILSSPDATEVQARDDWVVVGTTRADHFGNVGVTVVSPDQLSNGIRVDLLSDSVALYASIRKARQDVWAFARTIGDDPVKSATACADAIRRSIEDDDLVVLCYAYGNRDQFDAEARNDDAESSAGVVCARAYSSVGPGDADPLGRDLSPPDAPCPPGLPDDVGAGIERVPLPAGAVIEPTDDDGTGGPADADARRFRLPGMRLADLAAFYDAAMPIGSPWLGWSWCERHQLDDLDERVWLDVNRSGTGLLRISLGTDDEDGSAFVVVARHGTCSSI